MQIAYYQYISSMMIKNNICLKQQKYDYYSQYLKCKKQKQMQKLKAIPSKINPSNNMISNQNINFSNQKSLSNTKKQQNTLGSINNATSKSIREKWIKLDRKAYIINDKLLYIESEDDCKHIIGKKHTKSVKQDDRNNEINSKLMQLLKKHNIPLKEYIYGNRKQILERIKSRIQNNKNEAIQKYISKNIRNDDKVIIQTTDWYKKNKQNLFDDS